MQWQCMDVHGLTITLCICLDRRARTVSVLETLFHTTSCYDALLWIYKKKFTFTVPLYGTVKTVVRCVQRNGNRTLIER